MVRSREADDEDEDELAVLRRRLHSPVLEWKLRAQDRVREQQTVIWRLGDEGEGGGSQGVGSRSEPPLQ